MRVRFLSVHLLKGVVFVMRDDGNVISTNAQPGNRTVTFLMTDVEGSTRLWEEHPDAMQAALARHDAVAQEVIEQCNGRLVKSRGEGDSLFVVFSAPVDAVLAAGRLQHAFAAETWPQPVVIKSRMAIHAGDAEARDNDFYGQVVNRCARLRSIAHGGQVIISDAARLLMSSLPAPDWELTDLGNHRLKDLQHPEQVWQLRLPGLQNEFPRLNSLDVALSNLPEQITSFVGRDLEIARLSQMLVDNRLVTVVGSGGVGKTRLAMHVAADAIDNFKDGVWFVDLSAATDSEQVTHSIADAVGVREEPQRPIMQTLLTSLKSKMLLLILDNCEHLLSECAKTAEGLIRGCPHIKILASSREVLGIPGESLFRVPSLGVPDEHEALSVSGMQQYASVQLFVERVRAVLSDFELTKDNAKSVGHLVRMLDGIPFALELAAARVRAMPVQQLAERITDRFRLLTGGSRTALPRRQTLKAMMDWSFNLLNDQERILLARLSVFVGGWRLEDCEQVCAYDPLEDWEIVDLLTSLVDKSLVIFGDKSTDGRYRLLESVRQYAGEHLGKQVDADECLKRHALNYLQRAKEYNQATERFGISQQESSRNFSVELSNLRAGMDFVVTQGMDREVADYGGALARYLIASGFYSEADQRFRCAEQSSRNLNDSASLAQMLLQRGRIAWLGSDIYVARALYQEAYELSKADDNKESVTALTLNLGNIAWAEGDYSGAATNYRTALENSRSTGNMRYQASALCNLGVLFAEQANFRDAADYFEQAVGLHRKQGNARGCADALMNLGETLRSTKDYQSAIPHLLESLELFLELGARHEIGMASSYLASAYYDAGMREQSDEFLADALQISMDLDDCWILMNCEVLRGSSAIADGKLDAGLNILVSLLEVLEARGMSGPSQVAHVLVSAGTRLSAVGRRRGAALLASTACTVLGSETSRHKQAAQELFDDLIGELGAQEISDLAQPYLLAKPVELLAAVPALDKVAVAAPG